VSKLRIGLYGGSFDPVHLGHLLVAQAAREERSLDQIHFILAAQSPFKPQSNPAAPADRLRMLRSALAGFEAYHVDDQEIHRGGVSYTIDTVRNYKTRFPDADLFFLIGADHIRQLPAWRDAHQLAEWLEFVVIPRPGQELEPLPKPFRGQPLRGFPLGVSSSQIRERVSKNAPIDWLVPSTVAEIIRTDGLYR